MLFEQVPYVCRRFAQLRLPHAVCYHARAVEDIKRELPNAQIDWLECDLGNLR